MENTVGMRISTNLASINAQRSMAGTQREANKTFAQLASGSRITKSADDAAGLSISETLKSSIRGLTQAQRNANDGMSMIQVAEGSLGEISNILTRMRELGVQAASDTIGDQERGFIDKEVQQLKQESERIAQSTRFGDTKLLNGESDGFDFQVSINNKPEEDRIRWEAGEVNATTAALGIDGFDFTTKEGAREALETVEQSQRMVNGHRATLGAVQSRLMSTTDNLGVAIENYSAANSRIRDADVAQSTADLSRNNVLLNANIGVLAQANAFPASALKLIG
jgi:flagellin